MIHKRVNQIFKDARIDHKVTQMEIAELLGYESAQFVSNWERNLCSAPTKSWAGICGYLRIPIQSIINAAVADYKDQLKEEK